MGGYRTVTLMLAILALAGCTSVPDPGVDPTAPVQTEDLSHPPPDSAKAGASKAPDYTHVPGYAPAYPPY